MDKIVCLTGHSEGYDRLNACFTMLFPECEIRIISVQAESYGNVPAASEPAAAEKGKKKNGKNSIDLDKLKKKIAYILGRKTVPHPA